MLVGRDAPRYETKKKTAGDPILDLLWSFHPVLQGLVGFFLIDGFSPCDRASYHAHTQAPTASGGLPLRSYRHLLPILTCLFFPLQRYKKYLKPLNILALFFILVVWH